MWQLVPPGGQTAGGHRPILAPTTTSLAELWIWVEATAPVTTSERAKVRAMSFMGWTFLGTSFGLVSKSLWLNQMS